MKTETLETQKELFKQILNKYYSDTEIIEIEVTNKSFDCTLRVHWLTYEVITAIVNDLEDCGHNVYFDCIMPLADSKILLFLMRE